MDFKRLSEQAKRLISRRGGTDSLKEDANELRDIARGEGSLSDKAKAAADAIKEPGARTPDTPETGVGGAATPEPPATPREEPPAAEPPTTPRQEPPAPAP